MKEVIFTNWYVIAGRRQGAFDIERYGGNWTGYSTGSLEELKRNIENVFVKTGGRFYYTRHDVPSAILNGNRWRNSTGELQWDI